MAIRNNTVKRIGPMMKKKVNIVYIGILCMFLVLIVRLVYCTLTEGKRYETIVLGQQNHSSTTLEYERGKIYDRDGNILAANEKIYTMVLEPKNILLTMKKENGKKITYLDTTVEVLCRFFDFDAADLTKTINDNEESYYVVYKKNLTYDDVKDYQEFMTKAKLSTSEAMTDQEKEEINLAKSVTGVIFEESYKRVYPYDTLACKLIGFTSAGNVGNWGIEQYYNDVLNGTQGRSFNYFNDELDPEQTVKNPENGNSIVTTIDMEIQQVIEKKLKAYDNAIGSKMTSILVMDPNNGEILGMASSHPYNLNDPMNEDALHALYSDEQIAKMKAYTSIYESQVEAVAEQKAQGKNVRDVKKTQKTIYDAYYELWRNNLISDTNEPGSTYKPLTVAAGLDSGTLKGDESYYCGGALAIGKRRVGCSHTHGSISLKQSVSESCNVAMMTISFKEGKDIFYDYQHVFGFGKKTGVDLPGETSASTLIYTADSCMNDVTLATNAFGQNFNCTMVQMASAFASLINGGNYYKPHVAKQIVNNAGDVVEDIDKQLIRTTVSEATSKTLRNYMRETVESGTGTKAQIEGYDIGGKTGTAEKLPRNKKDYYVSFMGFVPVNNPQVLIYVTIDEPAVKKQDNAGLAVQLEQACMKEIIKIMGIEKK